MTPSRSQHEGEWMRPFGCGSSTWGGPVLELALEIRVQAHPTFTPEGVEGIQVGQQPDCPVIIVSAAVGWLPLDWLSEVFVPLFWRRTQTGASIQGPSPCPALELLNSYGMADEFMQAGCFLRQVNLHKDVDRNKIVLE